MRLWILLCCRVVHFVWILNTLALRSLLLSARCHCMGQLTHLYGIANVFLVELSTVVQVLGVEDTRFHVVVDVIGFHLELQRNG